MDRAVVAGSLGGNDDIDNDMAAQRPFRLAEPIAKASGGGGGVGPAEQEADFVALPGEGQRLPVDRSTGGKEDAVAIEAGARAQAAEQLSRDG